MFEFRRIRIGFFCSTADNRLTTNRKFRLQNLSFERVIQTLEKNLSDLKALLDLSVSLGCGIFRLGSDLVPFASHQSFRKEWLRPVEERLCDFAPLLKTYPIRLTMHPGQFVVLSSPKREVVDMSLRELQYHFWLLDLLGVGREGVVVIHVGGVYDGKKDTLKRFRRVIDENPWLRERLVVENDERHYTICDLLNADLRIPLVFDHYHHSLNPCQFEPEDVLTSWNGLVPEFHLSSRPDGKHRLGEHGDWVRVEDFLHLSDLFGERRIDLIIEAKQKEKAVANLIHALSSLSIRN